MKIFLSRNDSLQVTKMWSIFCERATFSPPVKLRRLYFVRGNNSVNSSRSSRLAINLDFQQQCNLFSRQSMALVQKEGGRERNRKFIYVKSKMNWKSIRMQIQYLL